MSDRWLLYGTYDYLLLALANRCPMPGSTYRYGLQDFATSHCL